MSGAGMLYVCDSCGHIEVRDAVPEGDEWTCDQCQSHTAWEFPPENRAYAENARGPYSARHG